MQRLLLAMLLAHLSAHGAAAQDTGTAGFLSAYAPEDRAAFEAGYRRHLEWHRSHEDSLAWFGWDVLVGRRPGVFVDGVFAAPFGALDERVDPAGDRADAAANVVAYAVPLSRELVALRTDLSSATPLNERVPTRFVQVSWYAVAPARMASVEAALAALHEEAGEGSLLPYTVYERVAGAEPGFVLMVWRDRLATFDEHGRDPVRALHRILGVRASGAGLQGLVRSVTSEVWLYRRDLTYLPTREER